MRKKVNVVITIFIFISIHLLLLNVLKPYLSSFTVNKKPLIEQGFCLEITAKDNFVLYEWPTISPLSTGDFTIEVQYLTTKQNEVLDDVAIFSNERDSESGVAYGRFFSILLLSSGKVGVRFQGYEPKNRTFFNGTIEGSFSIDDGEWHHILVTRNASIISLYVDGLHNGFSSIRTNIDLDGQEQKIVIGGGNDRKFRRCQIDDLRVWRKQWLPSDPKREFDEAERKNCQYVETQSLVT